MKIFLDMDGVLTNCHFYALSYYGVHLTEYPKGLRVKDILNGREIRTPASYEEFWAEYTEDFWDSIPKTEECDRIVRVCTNLVGEDNIWIASRPTNGPGSYSGKKLWVLENLPEFLHQRLILIDDKELLAAPDAILVDDSYQNCEKFREAGGQAVFFERPWNGNDHMVSTEWIEAITKCVA